MSFRSLTLSGSGARPAPLSVWPKYTIEGCRNLHLSLRTRKLWNCSHSSTCLSRFTWPFTIAVANKMSSTWLTTPDNPCRTLSKHLWKIAGLFAIPKQRWVYWNNPQGVLIVVNPRFRTQLNLVESLGQVNFGEVLTASQGHKDVTRCQHGMMVHLQLWV